MSLENVSGSNVSGLGVRKCGFLYDGFQECQVLLLWVSFGIFLICSKKGMYKSKKIKEIFSFVIVLLILTCNLST